MANEADALSLLALTATGEKKGSGRSPGTASEPADTPDGRQSERSLRSEGSSHRRPGSNHAGDGTGAAEAQTRELDERDQDAEAEEVDRIPTPPPLADCDLIRKGALTKRLLVKYVDQFFRRHHQIFVRSFDMIVILLSTNFSLTDPRTCEKPMIPISRMPKTELELQAFAQDEKHLLTAMVIIASRHDAENPLVHEKAWDIMSVRWGNLIRLDRLASWTNWWRVPIMRATGLHPQLRCKGSRDECRLCREHAAAL